MTDHVTHVTHPLVQHKLTLMRQRDTSTASFRQLLREISQLPAYEVTRGLPMTTRRIDTPLEPMDRLSEVLGGPRLWVKRDDCTGLSSGGNKTRKLEFTLADALERRADVLVTSGGTQSNHVRQTAAAASRSALR